MIRALAARQNGVVSREGLLRAGLTKMEIETRLRDGRLAALHRGVYLVGALPARHAYPQAALLACGRDSALSHRSAAAIWNLWPYPDIAHPWVTIPSTQRTSRPNIAIRRAPLEQQDVRIRHGMRLVSPPRAILDCAALVGDRYELEALVAEASYRGLASEDELSRQVERNRGRPGVAALRQVLNLDGGPQRTRSKGERWFLRLLRESGIDGYEVNQKVFGREVDFLWRELDFCVELDGWDAHKGRVAFERDREKWAHLQSNGIDVMPLSPRRAQRDKDGTLDRLRKTLAHKAYRSTQ